ncbi:MAG: hypothetical protein OEU55_13295, partial [Desulfobacterales bacterium]|nr:hypothetical protein [Desulfobacterales bacterium]
MSEKDDSMRILIILNLIRFLTLTPDTRHLKPVWLKEKIDIINPYFTNYLEDITLGWILVTFSRTPPRFRDRRR